MKKLFTWLRRLLMRLFGIGKRSPDGERGRRKEATDDIYPLF